MMNDKDLQRKMKEQQIKKRMNERIKKLMNELLDSYEDELPQIDEKNEHKEVKEFKPEKCRIVDMLDRINNNENVLDMLGFIAFKDGNGLLFRKSSDYTFETVSLMIIEMYEQFFDDVYFDEFLDNLTHNAKVAWKLRGLE